MKRLLLAFFHLMAILFEYASLPDVSKLKRENPKGTAKVNNG
jgi:hypothetical protein